MRETRNANKIVAIKYEGKIAHGRSGRNGGANIKVYLKNRV
jgi:hypothetical protein